MAEPGSRVREQLLLVIIVVQGRESNREQRLSHHSRAMKHANETRRWILSRESAGEGDGGLNSPKVSSSSPDAFPSFSLRSAAIDIILQQSSETEPQLEQRKSSNHDVQDQNPHLQSQDRPDRVPPPNTAYNVPLAVPLVLHLLAVVSSHSGLDRIILQCAD